MEVKIDQHMTYQRSLSSGHLMNERRKMIDLNVEGTTIQSSISIIFIENLLFFIFFIFFMLYSLNLLKWHRLSLKNIDFYKNFCKLK